MGSYDRDYMQDDFSRQSGFGGGSGGGMKSWSVVTWLVVINISIFLLQSFADKNPSDLEWASLSLASLKKGYIWTIVTNIFFHQNLIHLLMNMVGLFLAGRFLRQLVSGRAVFLVFLLGGMVGGLLQVLVFQERGVIGASGGVMSVFLALACLLPNFRFTLLLFFVIPVTTSLKRMAQVLVGLDILLFAFSLSGMSLSMSGEGASQTAYLAHLGGAGFGLFYALMFLKPSMQTSSYEPQHPSQKKSRFFGRKKVINAEVLESVPTSSKPRGRTTFRGEKASYVSPDVDAILDKISAEGMHSLTDEERQLLEDSSEQIARRTGSGR